MKNKREKMKKYLTLAALISTSAMAEGVGSHGGNSVVCFSDPTIADQLTKPGIVVSQTIPDQYISKITSVTTLDLHEALIGLHGDAAKDPVPMNPNESEEAYAERISKRFNLWHEALKESWYNHYLPNLKTLYSNGTGLVEIGKNQLLGIAHLTDPSMIPANDITPITAGKPGCVYATMAKQIKVGNSTKKTLMIDDRLYYHPTHTSLSRAALLVHEYVLAAMGPNKQGQTNEVRAVTANVMAKDVVLGDLLSIFGNNISNKVVPTAISPLIELAKSIYFEFREQETSAMNRFEREYTNDNLDTLPRRVRLYIDPNRSLLGEPTKNERQLIRQFETNRSEYAKKAWELEMKKIFKSHEANWKIEVAKALIGIQNLRITADRMNSLVVAIQTMDPTSPDYAGTKNPSFYFSRNEVMFFY
jgi:hypothetical protein